ncbi:carboxylating nicotinate-nucleotide diphosphorylase [Alphaproteobacteria bacterium]|nr:carboxylating nicotinate-nucleotide diphosphorylase [Alphaproteobacteria bacterium]
MTSTPIALNPERIRALVTHALMEDLGDAGDLTSLSVIPDNAIAQVDIVARDTGVCAGLDFAEEAFKQLAPSNQVSRFVKDGDPLQPGTKLMHIEGHARSILSAERVALNFMGHMSGIASETAKLVKCISGTHAKICDTRKTTPGLRAIEKYAVRMGGGVNHRFGLYDAILIKDNHIAVAGSISKALEQAFAYAGHMVQVEIEVDTLDQLQEALASGAGVILLDNMSPEQLSQAVEITNKRAKLEASGRVSLETVRDIALSGVDYISVGRITHSAPCLDLGLDITINT